MRKAGPPVIVYTNSHDVAKREELISRGATEGDLQPVLADRNGPEALGERTPGTAARAAPVR
jgi:hypothetical protein